MARFHVNARTVEMLGRQQVAGISTAISEIFKNAHDAYASHVSAEFYRSLDLLVIRDNGCGMTRKEFEERWLTLGTDYKADLSTLPLLRHQIPNRKDRPILGEKGIGRLALAVLGPQVLIQTRSFPSEKNSLVSAFIHWGIFTIPGLRLEDIEIPILETPFGHIPSNEHLTRMVSDFRKQLPTRHKNPSIRQTIEEIDHQLHECRLDLEVLKRDIQDQDRFSLTRNSGTHFYITPPDEQIAASLEEIDDFEKDTITIQPDAPNMLRTLIGFNNTMFANEESPACEISFAALDGVGSKKTYFTDQEFFTPEDCKLADHYFDGSFDEIGNFEGTVSIFGEQHAYSLPWKESNGRITDCGPFTIRLGYLQGEKRKTSLDVQSHSYLIRKLNSLGGLYIYRDGVRILPYGNSDNDFLNVEKRRTKSASYYYFSHRRMFGAVELTRKDNTNLREKAGREGFQANTAYRQFRAILENFFIQLAADFFREGGEHSETFINIRRENERNFILQKKREKQRREKQRKFASELDVFFDAIEQGRPQTDVKTFLEQMEIEISDMTGTLLAQADIRVGELIAEAENRLEKIRVAYRLFRPRDTGITKRQKRDWEAYQVEFDKLENSLFVPTKKRIASLFSPLRKEDDDQYDYCEELFQIFEGSKKDFEKSVRSELKKVEMEKSQTILRVDTIHSEISTSLDRLINEKKESLDKNKKIRDVEKMRIVVDETKRVFTEQHDEWSDRLRTLRSQLESVAVPEEMEEKETFAAIEDELEELHEQADVYFELAQIGLALGVLHHEFQTGYAGMTDAIRQLKRWADRNPSMMPLYDQFRTKFDQINGYMRLADPLMKFRNRDKTIITGESIRKFLIDAFERRWEKVGIKFDVTDAFKSVEMFAFQSEIYPCFVNLIDNSIYWLEDCREKNKKIELDSDAGAIVITDNGPGIPTRDIEQIFEMGFTRKPGGRGMGLYIAKKSLNEAGYDIFAVPKMDSKLGGAEFHITKR